MDLEDTSSLSEYLEYVLSHLLLVRHGASTPRIQL